MGILMAVVGANLLLYAGLLVLGWLHYRKMYPGRSLRAGVPRVPVMGEQVVAEAESQMLEARLEAGRQRLRERFPHLSAAEIGLLEQQAIQGARELGLLP